MKNSITREELKQIHDIACEDWKKKIINFGNKDTFAETIKFTEKQIQEMIDACTAEQLPIVKKIFDVKDSWEDIKTPEDAIKKLGENDVEVIQLRKLQSILDLSEAILNNQIAVVISRALNDGWQSNWNDSNEYKYFPWFYLGDSFHFLPYHSWHSRSATSARLCLKSSELAIYAGKQFTEVYRKFMN